MKRPLLTALLASVLILPLLYACGGDEEAQAPEKQVTAEEVNKEAKEAAETVAKYTQQQKDEYLSRIEARLEEIDQQMQQLQDKMQAEAADLQAQTREEIEQSMQKLRENREKVAAKYEELKSASGSAWGDLKAGMDAALEDLNRAFEKVGSHFEG